MFSVNFIHHGARIDPKTSPVEIVALTIGITSGIERSVDLFFRFIADTKSEREKNLKPCRRTMQFSTGLVRLETSAGQNLLGGI
jgi:hypothetical protein